MIKPEEITHLRKMKNWSQASLASYLGVNQATVSRWEKGAPIKGPALKLILALTQNSNSKKKRAA